MASDDERTMRQLCAQEAVRLWETFDKNQRTGIRFGMFPAQPMRDATTKGFDSRMLSVALMDCAAKDGGMRA